MRKTTDPAPTEDLPADPVELGQPDGNSSGPATDPAPAPADEQTIVDPADPGTSLLDQLDEAILKAILDAVTPGTQPGTDFVDAALAQQLANVRATLSQWSV